MSKPTTEKKIGSLAIKEAIKVILKR